METKWINVWESICTSTEAALCIGFCLFALSGAPTGFIDHITRVLAIEYFDVLQNENKRVGRGESKRNIDREEESNNLKLVYLNFSHRNT